MSDFLSGFDDWTAAFAEWTDVSISELHGLMTAIVCAVKPPSTDEWATLLGELSFSVPSETALELLSEYGEDVSFALKDKDDAYEYTPLVPDDEHSLYERLVALKEWAGGFITGIGVADLHLGADELELLGDLAKIASLRPDPDEFDFFDGSDVADEEGEGDLHGVMGDVGGELDFEDNWRFEKDEMSGNDGEAMYLHLYEFARMVPVALSMRNKRAVKELALIKGLSQDRKTASELKLPPVVDAGFKH